MVVVDDDILRVEAAEQDGVRLVRLVGEIDLANGDEVGRALLAAPERPLVVDLRGTVYIDSVGFRMLFLAAARRREHGRTLAVLVEPGSAVESLLAVSGIGHVVQLVGDEQHAHEAALHG